MSSSTSNNNTSRNATLRPRTARLISGLDEGDETTFDAASTPTKRIASPLPSPYGSRPVSPIPSAHPQRLSPHARRHDGDSRSTNAAGSGQRKAGTSSPTLAGLWGSSLSALQGIAQDFLGSDLAEQESISQYRTRRPYGKLHTARTSTSAPPTEWGPSSVTSNPRSGGIGGGTTEEQAAALRAQKRKAMLTGQETSYTDTLGKFKRRLSDDRTAASAPPSEGDGRDALAYIHHVTKNDTLAGITIRYNISANMLRKANRMWPNDSVQMRKTLFLPVDACGVKGKPATAAEMDLLGSESESLSTLQAEEVPTPTAANPTPNGFNHSSLNQNRDRTNSASTHTSTSAASVSGNGETEWQHDSWVLLPGATDPVQIARLPRTALGYFPPARRKSNSWSDQDTPSSSLELSRSNNTDVFGNSDPPSSPRNALPPQRPRRRPSNATNGYFPSYLTGPGGVGTMDRNVRFPGPAQDGLNKMMAKHLPDVAPPRNQSALYQPDLPLYTDEATPIGSGAVTPAYPLGGGGTGGLHLQDIGGSIESWVRRLATKSTPTPGGRQYAARASVGTPGKGAGGIGDLIEMTDEFEIGGDDEEGRGRQGSHEQATAGGRPGTTATSYFDSIATGGVSRERRAVGKSGKAD
ncbi:Putative LysM and putative peptidoglycan-binding domain-containing protein 1-4 [Septoria linicola]|uniref:LysM and putative peptidoglycan-binding domain-containing protein 1-4 n=1 Tax=Septoria linicola TaxID=215465 RepID=A0A9Q9EK92_9PEZI|nr:putative LysM and putative peptidoglycan-binding domain-containing protein 1-4 [Septoria linicola]USW54571.1 Putative LysM and putative peptidoglycan-binding domain-containing protein 1-4 [Septoria linicola]